jgi:glycosyltransferase involved in cell wall biosynthesis
MSRICILDDQFDRPAPPFLQEAFEELGHSVTTVFRSIRPPAAFEKALTDSRPDLLVAIHNVGFLAAETLTSECFREIRKAILFYDDPVSTYWLFGRRHPFISQAKENRVHFFIWDGYWRKQMTKLAGWDSCATHLAAEPKRFSPDRNEAIPAIRHCVVFLGNIPSLESIESNRDRLGSPHREVVRSTCREVEQGTYGCNPFELLDKVIEQLPAGKRNRVMGPMEDYLNRAPDLNQPLEPHIQMRRLVWQFAKRETRLRALRAASRVVPLAILSNLKVGDVAGQDELVRELGVSKKHDLLFVDTSEASYYQLAHLYRSGRFHLQTTDPQSVEGGIPYRVFQCAACGVPLVSDYKKELAECFKNGKEILFYSNEAELNEVLERIQAGKVDLKEVGMAGWRHFIEEHTWMHRMKFVLKAVGLCNSSEG